MTISVLGIDIGKNSFHLYGVDQKGKKMVRKKLSRKNLLHYIANIEPCLVAMEACGGAHYLARSFQSYGHEVKLISPQFVKPYVKSNKNDYNDAEAICEAATRPNMRFVPIKSSQQQSWQLLHRFRQQAVDQRTALVNQIRGSLLEEGIVVAQGIGKIRAQLPRILEDAENGLHSLTRSLIHGLSEELKALDKRIKAYDEQIHELANNDDKCRLLMTIPGIGATIATALVAAIGSPKNYQSGRHLAAWLGLVPKQHSTGGTPKLLGISKRGDKYLRTLLIHGARSVQHCLKNQDDRCKKWVTQLNSRCHQNVAAVGLANKMARIAWAVMASGEAYRAS
ncbi:MAG: IS110 family transposase [Endozoicomonas sp.]